MSEIIKLSTPLSNGDVEKLKSGDQVILNGFIFTARDAAHKRLVTSLDRGEELPLDIRGQVIFYTGPAPPKPGQVIGSTGPTTSSRMDVYAPRLMAEGLKGMIGKGKRSKDVKEAMKKYKCIYFVAEAGIAALLAKCIKSSEIIAYEDLETEAIRKLLVENFPVVVINDIWGNDFYEEGVKKYQKASRGIKMAEKSIERGLDRDIQQTYNLPLSRAVKFENLLFISGTPPIDPESGEIIKGDIEVQTRRVLDNIKIILENSGSSLDKVLKVTVYMTNVAYFWKFNDIYKNYFPKDPPARSIVPVCAFPLEFDIEVDCIAAV